MKSREELIDEFCDKSKSQIKQDVFALAELDFKTDGYFVEFGAANGVDLSNTYIMEKEFNWQGILAEPAKMWHESLKQNRNCHIDFDCVWSKSGEVLEFNELAELSTIDQFSDTDCHERINGTKYQVNTISLVDLLQKYNAPEKIDYLSIDTEGSEYEILSAFDFSKYQIKIITCEHNYTPMREKIFDLLSSHGYIRKHTHVSFFDDWYVLT